MTKSGVAAHAAAARTSSANWLSRSWSGDRETSRFVPRRDLDEYREQCAHEGVSRVVQSIVRDDLVGHAEALGIGRGQLIAEQGELHGPPETHLPREQPTLAVIDGVTQFHLGQGEARRRREHRQVGCEDQCSAESDRVAARTYDQHLRQVQQAAHERLDALQRIPSSNAAARPAGSRASNSLMSPTSEPAQKSVPSPSMATTFNVVARPRARRRRRSTRGASWT